MRGTKAIMVAAIAIGLLTVSGVGVVAQDADDGAVVTGFTGTLVSEGDLSFLPGPTRRATVPTASPWMSASGSYNSVHM
jgi:hypothetical protein